MIELKKFTRMFHIRFITCFLIFLSIAFPCFFIHDLETYDYSSGKVVTLNGLNAMNFNKKKSKRTEGQITAKKLDKALKFYQMRKGDPGYYEVETVYPEYYRLIEEAYLSIFSSVDRGIDKIKDVSNYYNQRLTRTEEVLQIFSEKKVSDAERKILKNQINRIPIPSTLGFYDQWVILIKSLGIIYMALGIFSVFIATGVFSYEKENKMDLIIASCDRSKLKQMSYRKVLATVVFIGVLFVILTLITMTLVLGVMGIKGWSNSIQSLPRFYTVLYPWTNLSLILHAIAMGGICILAITMISLFFDAWFQQRFIALIISALTLFLPIVLAKNHMISNEIKKIFAIQPMQGLNIFNVIKDPRVFLLNVLNMNRYNLTMIIAGLISICLIALIGPTFSNKIRQK